MLFTLLPNRVEALGFEPRTGHRRPSVRVARGRGFGDGRLLYPLSYAPKAKMAETPGIRTPLAFRPPPITVDLRLAFASEEMNDGCVSRGGPEGSCTPDLRRAKAALS